MATPNSSPAQPDLGTEVFIEQVLRRINVYARHPAQRLCGHRFLVAKDARTNRGYFVTEGNFGRNEFKAAMAEAQAAGLDASVIYVYGRTATYSGRGIHFVKLDEIDVTP